MLSLFYTMGMYLALTEGIRMSWLAVEGSRCLPLDPSSAILSATARSFRSLAARTPANDSVFAFAA